MVQEDTHKIGEDCAQGETTTPTLMVLYSWRSIYKTFPDPPLLRAQDPSEARGQNKFVYLKPASNFRPL